MTPDPVTVELVRNALLTVIREMRADIVLTAFGSQIKEAEDFSCALMTATGELLGITEGTPVHLVPGTLAVRGIREKFGDDIAPGDVFMVNDPYILSSHLNDVAFLAPHFEDGAVCLWAAVRGHYLDIGGMTLGSISPVATDIHQEGLIIPVVITVYQDRSYSFITKTPPAAVLLKRAAGIAKGSAEPNKEKVARVTMKQVQEIARTKMPDLNANDLEAASLIIMGTARSMGVEVED